jgi:hypothetical protein
MSQAIALLGGASRPGWRAAWRARQLTKDRTRRRLATGLTRAVADAESQRQAVGAAIPVRRQAVLNCRRELLELAERLCAPRPAYAQGVAMAAELLSDACSPLYQAGGDLRGAVGAALAALDGQLE